jgi:hypothetical protein
MPGEFEDWSRDMSRAQSPKSQYPGASTVQSKESRDLSRDFSPTKFSKVSTQVHLLYKVLKQSQETCHVTCHGHKFSRVSTTCCTKSLSEDSFFPGAFE